jgi:glucose-6-phosphate isomerase
LLHIDPLDQPGVEAGKIATYALMGKKGFEAELDRIKAMTT